MIAHRVIHITSVDRSLRYLLLDQLRSLQQRGYSVAAISSPGPDVPLIEAAGVHHISVAISRSMSPLADVATLLRLTRALRREQPTIVHTHTPKAGLLGQLAARAAGVPIVVNTLHGFYFHEHMRPAARRFYIAMEQLAASCSNLILSQSDEDIATALRERICRPEQIRHLGNGISLQQFDPSRFDQQARAAARRALAIPEHALVLGFVGRLAARRKGFLDFLQAGKLLAARLPNIYFLIVGEADHGKDDAVDPVVAASLGIADRCRFVGQRPNGELPALYSTMNALALPSLFEGLPRAIMEAAAMGLPVVATAVKGNREAVRHEQSGLLVPFGDVERLAAALGSLLACPARSRDMGLAGRALAVERFDEQQVFARVDAEYRRLLQGYEPGVARIRSRTST